MKIFKLSNILLLILLSFIFTTKLIAIENVKINYIMRINEELTSPLRIAIDNNNFIYISDRQNRICIYDAKGIFINKINLDGIPLAIAMSHQNTLYVSDKTNNNTLVYDSNALLLKTIKNNFKLPASAIFNSEGYLYIVDSKNKCINIFDSNDNFITSFGDNILQYPTGIAYDKKNQRLLITEHGGLLNESNESIKMIHIFDMNGNHQNSFGEYGCLQGQFARIQGIAVDQIGRIFIADPYLGLISILNENGEFLCTVNHFNTESNPYHTPMDVAIDSNNRLYVTLMNGGYVDVYQIEDIQTTIDQKPEPTIVSKFELSQNYPNPFNPETVINFSLKKAGNVILNIYNLQGQLVRNLMNSEKSAGSYSVIWNGIDEYGVKVTSGTYLYSLKIDDFEQTKKLMFMK